RDTARARVAAGRHEPGRPSASVREAPLAGAALSLHEALEAVAGARRVRPLRETQCPPLSQARGATRSDARGAAAVARRAACGCACARGGGQRVALRLRELPL